MVSSPVWLPLPLPLAAAAAALPRASIARALGGRGRVDLEEVEEVVGADVAQAAGVEYREDAVFADGLVERGDQMLFGDRALAEELFHEFVFAFGDDFDERFVRGFGVVHDGVGDLAHFAVAVAIRRVEEGLHGDEVDYSVKALGVDDGKLDGDDLAAPALLHGLNHGLAADAGVCLGMVDLVDDDHAREVHLGGILPDAVGDGFEAGLRVDDDKRGFDGEHGGARLVQKHVEAGRVEEIDLGAAPFGVGSGIRHRGAPGHLFLVIRRDRGTIVHSPACRRHLGGLQERCDQRRLAAVRVANYSYVSNVLPRIVFHRDSSSYSCNNHGMLWEATALLV